jgi:hypothetical protein
VAVPDARLNRRQEGFALVGQFIQDLHADVRPLSRRRRAVSRNPLTMLRSAELHNRVASGPEPVITAVIIGGLCKE